MLSLTETLSVTLLAQQNVPEMTTAFTSIGLLKSLKTS